VCFSNSLTTVHIRPNMGDSIVLLVGMGNQCDETEGSLACKQCTN
jgi:hypothetical protein